MINIDVNLAGIWGTGGTATQTSQPSSLSAQSFATILSDAVSETLSALGINPDSITFNVVDQPSQTPAASPTPVTSSTPPVATQTPTANPAPVQSSTCDSSACNSSTGGDSNTGGESTSGGESKSIRCYHSTNHGAAGCKPSAYGSHNGYEFPDLVRHHSGGQCLLGGAAGGGTATPGNRQSRRKATTGRTACERGLLYRCSHYGLGVGRGKSDCGQRVVRIYVGSLSAAGASDRSSRCNGCRNYSIQCYESAQRIHSSLVRSSLVRLCAVRLCAVRLCTVWLCAVR